MWWLLRNVMYPQKYIWMDVILLKETRKAILIEFDSRREWVPRAWVVSIRHAPLSLRAPNKVRGAAISIKISEYHWAKKFQ